MDKARAEAEEDPIELSVVRDRRFARLMSWKPTEAPLSATYWQRRVLPGVGNVLEGEPKALGISPQDWLLVSSGPIVPESSDAVAELADQGLVVVDVSAGMAGLTLRGTGAPRVLTQSCGIDPRELGDQRCARVRFAHIPVVLLSVKPASVYELYFTRSYGGYLASWLAQVAGRPKP